MFDEKKIQRLWLVFILIFWLAFIYIWATKGWVDSEFWSSEWWFDAYGHAIFGFVGALTIAYLIKRYAAGGIFTFAGQKILMIIVIAIVTLLGTAWEAAEIFWDSHLQPNYLNWLAKAQKNSADTTIDLLVNSVFAAIGMTFYAIYNFLYRRLYPDEEEKEDANIILQGIKMLTGQIQSKRKENLKRIGPAIKETLKNFLEKLE